MVSNTSTVPRETSPMARRKVRRNTKTALVVLVAVIAFIVFVVGELRRVIGLRRTLVLFASVAVFAWMFIGYTTGAK
jgi:hypothetical protein